MKRCEDCEYKKADSILNSNYCIKRLHKRGCWAFADANKCEYYSRIRWKFWRQE